jgi:hypothetical protein
VQFASEAAEGSSIVRTEYRIVGSSTTWTTVDGAGLPLSDPGTYIIGYRSVDSTGLVEAGRAIVVTVPADTTAPTATVKDGASFTVGSGGTYSLVSFKLYDARGIDKLTLNGVLKDVTNDVWSDLNFVKPGTFGGVAGENTLVVYDVAGNTSTLLFMLTS